MIEIASSAIHIYYSFGLLDVNIFNNAKFQERNAITDTVRQNTSAE